MNELRKRFERFFLKNRDKGIPNLMLGIAIGNLAVYGFSLIDPSNLVYSYLCFSRAAILKGQVWRLVTYVFTYLLDTRGWSFFLSLVSLFCFYQFGRILEQYWGRFKFNLYYLTGVVLMDLAALLLGGQATTEYLNISLFLAVATIAPEAKVMLYFIIPIKMKYMAWVYLGFTALSVVSTYGQRVCAGMAVPAAGAAQLLPFLRQRHPERVHDQPETEGAPSAACTSQSELGERLSEQDRRTALPAQMHRLRPDGYGISESGVPVLLKMQGLLLLLHRSHQQSRPYPITQRKLPGMIRSCRGYLSVRAGSAGAVHRGARSRPSAGAERNPRRRSGAFCAERPDAWGRNSGAGGREACRCFLR